MKLFLIPPNANRMRPVTLRCCTCYFSCILFVYVMGCMGLFIYTLWCESPPVGSCALQPAPHLLPINIEMPVVIHPLLHLKYQPQCPELCSTSLWRSIAILHGSEGLTDLLLNSRCKLSKEVNGEIDRRYNTIPCKHDKVVSGHR